ncbi:MAG: WXG100 family type VII secretion target [Erysipelotrichaceae bacterium]|nr:WXG100 family type VII secretion target [Erysipelotrichaceae bacterium]
MAELIIKKNELEKAIDLSDKIYNHLSDALTEANEMKAFLEQAKWSGKTRDAFYTYLSLIVQYHEELNGIMDEHAKVLKRLKESIEQYQSSDMVNNIRGL